MDLEQAAQEFMRMALKPGGLKSSRAFAFYTAQILPAMLREIRRREFDQAVAEELAQEMTLRLYRALEQGQYRGDSNAIVYLRTIKNSVLADHVRMVTAESRGGGGIEVNMDEPLLAELPEQVAGGLSSLRLCMLRALAEFSRDKPEQADWVERYLEGYTACELAVEFGISGAERPPCSTLQEQNARDRTRRFLKTAREYTAECRGLI